MTFISSREDLLWTYPYWDVKKRAVIDVTLNPWGSLLQLLVFLKSTIPEEHLGCSMVMRNWWLTVFGNMGKFVCRRVAPWQSRRFDWENIRRGWMWQLWEKSSYWKNWGTPTLLNLLMYILTRGIFILCLSSWRVTWRPSSGIGTLCSQPVT